MSLSMTVTREGIPPGARFHWEEAATTWSREAAPLMGRMLRARAPFRTGNLRSTIATRTEPGPESMMIVGYATAPYTPFVIKGTKPHPIVARNARALRWTGSGGIGVNFARSVKHPGTRANPFPDGAMEAIGPAVARLLAIAVQEAMIA